MPFPPWFDGLEPGAPRGCLSLRMPAELDIDNADDLCEALCAFLDDRPDRLTLDMTGTRLCTAAGVGALVRVRKHARAGGTELRVLVARGGIVHRVMDICGQLPHVTLVPER
ncbi:STAS domain-containing protein [Actinocorallia longicatena]|uniref:STAS domain-containing protein n=1 Tax=Actinocorallia longicatena TaxID=111803 RepID=A0ABP6QGQ7_9ACTN